MDRRSLAAEFRRIVDPRYVIEDAETRKPYECDGLPIYTALPMLVVLPDDVDQIRQILRLCHQHGVPVVARGAGTGLSGGALPHAEGVLLSLARLKRVLDIDPAARTARVEPGVTNLAISQAAARHGLYYGPDPSSQIACTIGGNVAENAGGVHCLKYGLTVHNVLSVDLVTIEGDLITLGGAALDGPGLDLLALTIGSEGLLGVVVGVTVRLLPIAEATRMIMAGFAATRQAGEAVEKIIAAGIIPAALEMMDSLAIKAAEDFVKVGYPTEAAALLLCDVDGTPEEVESQAAKVEAVFRAAGATSLRAARDDGERMLLWKGRKSAFPAVGRISPDYYCMDGTIPRGQLTRVLKRIAEMSAEAGLRVANVFHAGDGNLHPLILFDANVPGELERTEELGGRILELCVEVGGCITGEHGVGVEKIRQMPAQFDDREIVQLHAVKEAFDAKGLLNPGKGVPLLKQCQEYRALKGSGR